METTNDVSDLKPILENTEDNPVVKFETMGNRTGNLMTDIAIQNYIAKLHKENDTLLDQYNALLSQRMNSGSTLNEQLMKEHSHLMQKLIPKNRDSIKHLMDVLEKRNGGRTEVNPLFYAGDGNNEVGTEAHQPQHNRISNVNSSIPPAIPTTFAP